MSSSHVLFALWLGVIPALGAELGLIQSTASRHGISLNGQWRVIVDPYESGYFDYRYKPQADGGFGANKKPKSDSDLVEYDFDSADRLQVPGDWNTQRPDLMLYEGTVWYKREFDCPTPPGHRIFVWFGAANYRAMVFVNGVKVGEHSGGFTPFQFEITANVHDKGNVIVVKVDDQRRQEFIPTVMTDWWNYGGLTRSVRILDVPGTFVQDYSIQMEKGSQTHIAGWVRLNGADPTQKVTVRIPEAGITQTFTRMPAASPVLPSTPSSTFGRRSGPSSTMSSSSPVPIASPTGSASGRSRPRAAACCSTASRCFCAASPSTPKPRFALAASTPRPMPACCSSGPRRSIATSCACHIIPTTK
jgi:hypothetical protein